MTSFFDWFLHYDVMNSVTIVTIKEIAFVLKLAKFVYYFLMYYIAPTSVPFVCYYRRLERFKMILCLSKVFESTGWEHALLPQTSTFCPHLCKLLLPIHGNLNWQIRHNEDALEQKRDNSTSMCACLTTTQISI